MRLMVVHEQDHARAGFSVSFFQAYSVIKFLMAICNAFDLSLYPIALSESSNCFMSVRGVEKLILSTLAIDLTSVSSGMTR